MERLRVIRQWPNGKLDDYVVSIKNILENKEDYMEIEVTSDSEYGDHIMGLSNENCISRNITRPVWRWEFSDVPVGEEPKPEHDGWTLVICVD